MRHRFIPACVCLMTWTSSTGPDPTLPPATFTSIATNRVLSEPSRVVGGLSENIDVDRVLGDTYAAIALPLAPLGLLLKPIIYRSQEEICDALTEAARSNDLPAPFFIRLLFQESGFRPGVISSAGALGIAQFMPETANERGLDNPFDPAQAIPASARLLRDLSRKFGNLGLAAAAYNAGPKRIQDWLANKGPLPQETQDYVRNITSWPAATWTGSQQAGSPAVRLPQQAPCQELAGLLAWNGPDAIPMPAPNPLVIVARQVKLAKLAQRAARGKKPHTDGEAAKQVHDSKADAKTDGKTDGKTDDNTDAKADSKSDAKTAGKTDGKSSKSNSVVRN